MFKFILALLALLALSINVSAVAEITSLDSFNNGTSLVVRQGLGQPEDDGIISAAEYTPCQIPGNNGFMKKCYCFLDLENLWGIDRAYLVTAIDQACEYFTGGIGEPVSVYGQGEGMRKCKSQQPKDRFCTNADSLQLRLHLRAHWRYRGGQDCNRNID